MKCKWESCSSCNSERGNVQSVVNRARRDQMENAQVTTKLNRSFIRQLLTISCQRAVAWMLISCLAALHTALHTALHIQLARQPSGHCQPLNHELLQALHGYINHPQSFLNLRWSLGHFVVHVYAHPVLSLGGVTVILQLGRRPCVCSAPALIK